MEIIVLLMFFLIIFTSVSFTYIWYQVRKAQEDVNLAIKACRDMVVSANTGRWM